MEYLLGLLTGVVFLLVLCTGVFIGTRLNKHVKQKPPDIDDEEKRSMKKLNEDFIKVMSYNEHVARRRKG